MIYIDFVCLFVTGVAQLISKLNNKPFDESDETLFEVWKMYFKYIDVLVTFPI